MIRYRLIYVDTSSNTSYDVTSFGKVNGYKFSKNSLELKGVISNNNSINSKIFLRISNENKSSLKEIGNFDNKKNIPFRYHTQIDELEEQLGLSTYIGFDLIAIENDKNHCKISSWALIKDEIKFNPIFVIGSPRSGTSVIGNSLKDVLNLGGFAECHFVEFGKKSSDLVDKYFSDHQGSHNKGTMLYSLNVAGVRGMIQNNLKRIYELTHRKKMFVDKTPGSRMVESIQEIIEIWPESRFIFCRRRAIENVQSRIKKFPEATFETHCNEWIKVMQLWSSYKKQYKNLRFIEIDQFSIQNNSNKVGKEIVEFLSLDSSKIMEFVNYFKNNHPTKTSADFKPKSFEQVDWTLNQKEYFMKSCGENLEKYGYSLDESYYNHRTSG